MKRKANTRIFGGLSPPKKISNFNKGGSALLSPLEINPRSTYLLPCQAAAKENILEHFLFIFLHLLDNEPLLKWLALDKHNRSIVHCRSIQRISRYMHFRYVYFDTCHTLSGEHLNVHFFCEEAGIKPVLHYQS